MVNMGHATLYAQTAKKRARKMPQGEKVVIGNDFRIKITSITTGEYSDTSDNTFTITAK